MPILFYAYLSVFLALFLSHLIKFKVIIKYDSVLLITFKLLFFKYSFKPLRDKIEISNIFSLEGLFDELDDIKEILDFIFYQNRFMHKAYKEFLSHLKYKLIYLDILVSTDSASKTALAYSYTTSLVSCVISYFKSISSLEISRKTKINIIPSFLEAKPFFRIKVASEISVADLIYVWSKIGIKLLYSLILSQIKEARYGTKQAK